MKSALVILAVILSGCTSKTEFGPCIGLGEDRNPALEYRLSANNLVWAVLGFELLAPPIVVAVNETFCPVSKK